MKKIMIVDDEIFVRLGIKSIADWESHGYQMVCEATNGVEALEKIEQYSPDIVLTDLMMDKMDGFELIEQCGVKYPHIKFVVLSSYNDFDKVRKAMKLGAEDYIFKLTVKPEEILNVLDEVSKKQGEPPESHQEVLLRKNLTAIKTRLIKMAVQDTCLREAELLHEFQAAGLSLDFEKPVAALCISVDNFYAQQKKGVFPDLPLLKFSMENIVQEIISTAFRAETFHYDQGDVITLVELERCEIPSQLEQLVSTAIDCIRRYLGTGVTAATGKPFRGILGIREAFSQSLEVLSTRFLSGGEQLYCWAGPRERKNLELPEKLHPDVLDGLFQQGDFSGVEDYLRTVLSWCRGSGAENQQIRVELLELYQRFRRYALADQGEFDGLQDEYGLTLYEAVTRYDLLSSVEESFLHLLRQCAQFRESGGRACRGEIAAVLSFIRENLDQELTVQAASKIANMSESYFSHLFKNETGLSFINYVNKQKIEKAQQLLRTTDRRINEIALAVGIDNPNYFSILFKKWTGKSPNECRS